MASHLPGRCDAVYYPIPSAALLMPARRKDVTVSLEQEVPSGEGEAPRRIRVTMTLEPGEDGKVAPAETAEAIQTLSSVLESSASSLALASGGTTGPRPDRSLSELVESYRPRDLQLLDALLWEGEITPTEHEMLRSQLPKPGAVAAKVPLPSKEVAPSPPPSPTPAPTSPPTAARPAASATGTARPSARSVDQLLRELAIQDLRDVNRARGRELISYDEWAALKAHFEKRA